MGHTSLTLGRQGWDVWQLCEPMSQCTSLDGLVLRHRPRVTYSVLPLPQISTWAPLLPFVIFHFPDIT